MKENEKVGACGTHGKEQECTQVFGSGPRMKRSFRIPSRRWNDNNKMDIKEIMWENMAWIYLAQNRGKWRAIMETEKNNHVQFKTGAVY